ncbi:Hypothetical protein SRAE_2000364300 [Strongyloides ratti]|uniref:Uncharacterized protein n=1 Tax=Strongyloides ratti TaxID=34506 RepID=A0A090LN83_STRRB|nr:Hypothetical protein SRAE_2000364300 [Strongyloides ratti]CEF68990.1 Hypothetical protein SRAE_2000364300 [Strongyloides ratti]
MTIFNDLKVLLKNKDQDDKNKINNKVSETNVNKTENKYSNFKISLKTFPTYLYYNTDSINYNKNDWKEKNYKQNIISFFNDISEIKKEVYDIGKSLVKPSKKEKSKRNLILFSKNSLQHKNLQNKSGFIQYYSINPINSNDKILNFKKQYNTYPLIIKIPKLNNNNNKKHENNIYQWYDKKITDQKQSLSVFDYDTNDEINNSNSIVSNNSTIDVNKKNYKKKNMIGDHSNEIISRKNMIQSSSKYYVTFEKNVTLIIFNIYDSSDYIIIQEPLKTDVDNITLNEDSTNNTSNFLRKSNYE